MEAIWLRAANIIFFLYIKGLHKFQGYISWFTVHCYHLGFCNPQIFLEEIYKNSFSEKASTVIFLRRDEPTLQSSLILSNALLPSRREEFWLIISPKGNMI